MPAHPAHAVRTGRSEAFEALAALGRADTRLLLSAAECTALEALAAEWFACGVDRRQFTAALTAGLPETVHCAGAFVRKRLIAKMPPAPVQAEASTLGRQSEPAVIRVPVSLEPLDPEAVHAHAERIRAEMRLARSTRAPGAPATDG